MGSKNTRRDRQIVRVLWLLKALGEGSQVSVTDLARRFGTRRETIYRDLRTLEDIGYPIQGDENGRLSRPRLLEGSRTVRPDLRLSQNECLALLSLIKTNRAVAPFKKELASAEAKLLAMQAIPSEEPAPLAEIFSSSRAGAKQAPSDEVVEKIVKAILTKCRCRIVYRSPKTKAEKTYQYDPYRLRSIDGGIYCLGRIPGIDGLTTLAAERIRSVEITATAFDVDSGLDLGRYESDAFGVTLDDPILVVLRVRADQAPYVGERQWHPTQGIRHLPDGSIELTFCAGGMFEIERWILGWGDAMEVLAPGSLRERVQSRCQAMLRLYSMHNRPDKAT